MLTNPNGLFVMNVQPYERRPRFTVDQCKNLCQTSRLSNPQSPYACRSFVYDNNKQLCDLFAHTGTQSPSRLGKMSGWDYYIFNANNPQCQAGWTTISGTTTTWPIGPTPFPNTAACPVGQTLWWYRTTGYAFRGTPILQVSPSTMDQCQTICAANRAPDNTLAICKSFNFDSSSSSCEIFSDFTNNKVNLVKSTPASYYQKICMDSSLITNCPKRLDRYPQKVLVGLAEVVTDSSSFDDCVTKCLRSVQLYNIQCVSGEIFYDENTQNCILNVMSRKSRPDLFIDAQPVDNVDYFETGCVTGMASRQASQKLRTKSRKVSREDHCNLNREYVELRKKNPLHLNNTAGKQFLFHLFTIFSLAVVHVGVVHVGLELCDPTLTFQNFFEKKVEKANIFMTSVNFLENDAQSNLLFFGLPFQTDYTPSMQRSLEKFLIQNPDDDPVTTKKPSKRKNRLVSRPAALIRKVTTTTTTTPPPIQKPIVDDDDSANNSVDVGDESGVDDDDAAGRASLSSPNVRRNDAAGDEWTQWSDCDRSSDGRRVRYRRCSSDSVDKKCPLESENCDKVDGKTVPRKNADQANDFHYVIYDSTLNKNGRFPPKNFPCPENHCCKVFDDCRVGVKRSKDGSAWAWCPDPCAL
uniref:Apple domain-containing protein n=1 Tax=Romanomermis culicivorax TaxID=13658 RepID=A0A915I397_ROMCU